MDDNGQTCLHRAVVGGSLPVMRYLVDQYGFDLSLRYAVSCKVVHDSVWFVHYDVVFDVQYYYPRFRCCHTCTSIHTYHTQSHIHPHNHIEPHTLYMYHTHTHVSPKLATHYNSKQCTVAIVHAHMQPNSTPPPTFSSFTFSSFVQVVVCVLNWPCPTQSSGWWYPTDGGSWRGSPCSGQTPSGDIPLWCKWGEW